jgi:4-carboxymuconolactone decarboxylase
MLSAEEAFRRLAIGDPVLLAGMTETGSELGRFRLGELAEALVRVASLVPMDAPQSSYQSAVGAAMRTGATLEDLLAVLVAVASSVGSPRIAAAAPRIALAAGYDVEADIESADSMS